jgi:hypothetical protein
MLNLTKDQIAALSQTIGDALQRKQQQEDKKLLKMKAVRKLAAEYARVFRKLPKEMRSQLGGEYHSKADNWLSRAVIALRMRQKSRCLSSCDIRNKIVLFSIDADDLDAIFKKFGVKPD